MDIEMQRFVQVDTQLNLLYDYQIHCMTSIYVQCISSNQQAKKWLVSTVFRVLENVNVCQIHVQQKIAIHPANFVL